MNSGLPLLLVETTYASPADDDGCGDYCPEGDAVCDEGRYSFRETVQMMRGLYTCPSSYPIAAPTEHDWLTAADMETDMHTGDVTAYSMHLSPSATPRERRYWVKAWDAAGIKYNRGCK